MIVRRIPIATRRRLAIFPMAFACLLARLLFAKKGSGKRFIVIEPYGMGDVVSLRPMFEMLAKHSDNCQALIKPTWKDLLPSSPNLQMVQCTLPWTSYEDGQKYGLKSLFRGPVGNLIRMIREESPGSIGIDPRGDIRSILLLYLAGCRKVITLDHYLGTTARVPNWVAQTVSSDPSAKRWQTTEDLLRASGILDEVKLTPPRISSRLHNLTPIRRISCIPTAPWPGRLWPVQLWQELKRMLCAAGYQISGICGPGQNEECSVTLEGSPVNQAETVAEWIAYLNNTDLLITLDTGPMHLADSMGVPLVALFGPGQLPMWAPSGRFSVTVHHQDAPDFFPCHQVEENIALGKKWMGRITVDEVYAACQKLVQSLR